MNLLTKSLLGGAALCALATAPAIAANLHPAMHVTALHAGKAVNKTVIHNQSRTHLTYTFGVYTYVSASNAGTAVKLAATYYTWNSNGTLCSSPKEQIKVPKKTKLAKLGHSTETVFWKAAPRRPDRVHWRHLQPQCAEHGRTDHFTSTLIGKFNNGSAQYKGTPAPGRHSHRFKVIRDRFQYGVGGLRTTGPPDIYLTLSKSCLTASPEARTMPLNRHCLRCADLPVGSKTRGRHAGD